MSRKETKTATAIIINNIDNGTYLRVVRRAPAGHQRLDDGVVNRSGKHHIKKTRWKDNPWGKIIGTHEGAQFYTNGQRKGLSIGGHARPTFVISTDITSNRVYVGEGEDHKGLWRRVLRIAPDEVHWMRPDLVMANGNQLRCRVRIRYRQELQDAVLLMRGCGLFVVFDTPQRSITPGQFAAFYGVKDPSDPYDAPELLGSGVIQQ